MSFSPSPLPPPYNSTRRNNVPPSTNAYSSVMMQPPLVSGPLLVAKRQEDEEAAVMHDPSYTVSFPYTYIKDAQTWEIIHILFNAIYAIAFLMYCWILRTFANEIIYGYPRLDLKPGPLVNDRLALSPFVLLVATLNMFPILLALWMLRPIYESWRRSVHLYVNIALLTINTVTLVTLFVYLGVFCNTSMLGYALCNDPRFCHVYGASFPERCLPTASSSTSVSLSAPVSFWLLVVSVGVFMLMNALMWISNLYVSQADKEYVQMLALKQR